MSPVSQDKAKSNGKETGKMHHCALHWGLLTPIYEVLMTQDDLGWLETKLNDSKWLKMTQDSCGQSLNNSTGLKMSQVYSCSSFLESVWSW